MRQGKVEDVELPTLPVGRSTMSAIVSSQEGHFPVFLKALYELATIRSLTIATTTKTRNGFKII